METPLTLLYTYDLRGDLALLPHLFTVIQQRRRGLKGERVLLVDLGASCDPIVWPCGITEGRAPLLVLDAMGFDVANVQGVLTPDVRDKLAEQVTIALVDDEHVHLQDDVLFALRPQAEIAGMQVMLRPERETRLDDSLLRLGRVRAGQVGYVRLHGSRLVDRGVDTVRANTLVDPTIAGTVDFVISEARYYERKQGDA